MLLRCILPTMVLCLGFLMTPAKADGTELHVVGVYEGNVKTDGRIHGPEVRVDVNRPGESVTLALGSYEAVKFLLTVSDATTVEKIYLFGYQPKSIEVVVNGATVEPELLNIESYAYKDKGNRFRSLVDRLTEKVGVERLASFNGAYTAPATPFRIDRVRDAPELKPVYLSDFVRPEAVPESLRPFLDGNRPMPAVQFSDKGFVLEDNGVTEIYPITLDVPTVSWPVDGTYDSVNRRIYGVSLGGEGFLYVYDLDTDTWSVATSMNQADATGMIHDAQNDRLLIALGRIGGGGLVEWTETGGFRRINLSVKETDLPGYTDLYDPGNGPLAPLIPIAIDGDALLLQATSERHMMRTGRVPDKTRTYLVDLSDGTAELVAYKGD